MAAQNNSLDEILDRVNAQVTSQVNVKPNLFPTAWRGITTDVISNIYAKPRDQPKINVPTQHNGKRNGKKGNILPK